MYVCIFSNDKLPRLTNLPLVVNRTNHSVDTESNSILYSIGYVIRYVHLFSEKIMTLFPLLYIKSKCYIK